LANAYANPATQNMSAIAEQMGSPEFFQQMSKPITEALSKNLGKGGMWGGQSSYKDKAITDTLGQLYAGNLNNVFNQQSMIAQTVLPYMEAYWKEPDATMEYLLSF